MKYVKAILFSTLFVILSGGTTLAATVEHGFRPFVTLTRNTLINVIVAQPDGKYLVGGNFSSGSGFTRNGIARFNVEGDLDTTFIPAVGGQISSISLQPDGKILIAGFGVGAVVNGVNRNGVVRLNSDGSIDQTFWNGTGSTGINFVAVQPDGRVLVSGLFSTINGIARDRFARLNSDASLDPTFLTQVSGNARSAVFLPDGKLIVAGELNPRAIARLNHDGSIDTSFTFTSTFRVNALKLQPDGKLLIGRFFNPFVDPTARGVVRLNTDDSVDKSFVADIPDNFNPEVMSLEIQSDGKILVGGRFTRTSPTTTERGLYRLTSTGGIDGSFEPLPECVITAIHVRPDGSIVVGGTRDGEDGAFRNLFFRLTSSGVRDPEFPASVGNAGDVAVAKSTGGKYYIAGNFVEVNGMERKRIARLNGDGTIDQTFNPIGTNGTVSDLALQSDGKVLIVGDFGVVNGISRLRMARLNADGSVDEGFQVGEGFDGPGVRDVVIQQDGKIIVAGQFNNYNGMPRPSIARLNADGSLDTAYNVTSSPTWSINTLAPLSNGQLLIGGNFQSLNGASIGRIALLNENGTTDTAFNLGGSGANGSIMGIALQSDGRIVIGGFFNSYNGVSRISLARILANGSLDQNFVATANNVNVVAAEPNGKIIAGGNISSANGISRNGLARFNPDGSLDLGFDGGTKAGQSVHDIDVNNNGEITVGGTYTQFGGLDHLSLAQIKVEFAEISGRVRTPDGRGHRSAVVAITDRSGITRTATTSTFGFYSLSGIETGTSYTVSVLSRRFRFLPLDRLVNGDISDLDFLGLQ